MSSASPLTVTADGPVRVVTLNRPDNGNTITAEMHPLLLQVWSDIQQDPDARVVVLTGAGKNFTFGGDFGWMRQLHADPKAAVEGAAHGGAIVRAMVDFPLPVVAALRGAVTGLGCSLAVLSDFVLLAPDVVYRDPHVAIGLVAGDGGVAAWPASTGLLSAKKYLLTGDPIPAEHAVQIGLASQIVPEPEDVLDAALTLARRLAAQPQFALRETKKALNMHLSATVERVLDFGTEAEGRCFSDPEHRALVAGWVAR